ncbi:MAG: ribosome-associated translation inhibitor RaiA, partial [Proteobacteria bacterium]|nr:ribosome-associated translation inhibitor RaiA [Pseudomonadota bacterium]
MTGVHMATGEALKAHTEAKMQELKHYFEHVMDVHVAFVKEVHHHHLHGAEVTVHVSGLTLRAEGQGIDFYAAIDDAQGKLLRQLEKYKGRLGKHRERRRKLKEKERSLPPLAMLEAEVEEEHLEAVPADMFAEFAPKIAKKEVSRVAPMTVDEAVNFFRAVPKLHAPSLTLAEVGLGYLRLGQSATTLSGGEAQRL